MLLEMGMADAYGIAWEFLDDHHQDTRPNTGRTYYQNPKYLDLKPGCYTDDTQRALANMYVLIDRDPFSIASYANSYVATFQHDPRNGYSRRYQAFLESVDTGIQFIDRIDTSAESNGAIMGVLPLGYLPTPGMVRAAAAAQAMATHAHSTVPYAQHLALLAHYYIHPDLYRSVNLIDFIKQEMRWPGGKAYAPTRQPGPVKMSAHDTWAAVIELQQHTSLLSILRAAIDLRGDTDSVAALAVGLASLHPAKDHDLPQELYDKFEPTPFGRDYLLTPENTVRHKYGLSLL
jgi:ADP-ribosyl-[dinitrogen reductase] hydrolase